MASSPKSNDVDHERLPGTQGKIARTINGVESFFDGLKLSYKWRFNRFFHLNVVPYRGFGTRKNVWFRGRVLDDRAVTESAHDSVWQNVRTTLKRIETDEIPDATVRVRFYEVEVELQTDGDGFFDAVLEPASIDENRVWHEVHVELLRPRLPSCEAVSTTGEIIIPPPGSEFGVISDIDDTVIRSGAYNRLQMGRVVLLNSSHTRTPFPGVAEFYQALHLGADGAGANPIFYVSSSPWNLYNLFDDFMRVHDVPAGPILLRDYGFSEEKLFKPSHESHKTKSICRILDHFSDLQFVLIGDSGQRDPEIYRQIVHERPDRIRAIFIRDVTPPGRDAEVRAIAEEIESTGVPMALVDDTAEAIEIARYLELLSSNPIRSQNG